MVQERTRCTLMKEKRKHGTEKKIITETFALSKKTVDLALGKTIDHVLPVNEDSDSRFHCNLSMFEPYSEPEISNSALLQRQK